MGTQIAMNAASLAGDASQFQAILIPQYFTSVIRGWNLNQIFRGRSIAGFVGLAEALCLKKPLIDTVQALFLLLCLQRIMLDIEKVINDKPHGLVGRHPVLGIEPFQVHWNGISPEGPLPSKIEVRVEIA